MDLLQNKIKPLYFRYLAAAFGSALISSIYGLVDMAMVGQYQGPVGTAALAVVAPVWNLIYSLGLLTGIGGSVLFGTVRGKGRGQGENQYFTGALLGTALLALVSWGLIVFGERPLLELFGADEALLPLAGEYLRPIKFVIPAFLFNQMLAAFLRNDGAPGLATAGVLAGGIFNVFGDYFFVFTMNMGMEGAGLATALGACITLAVMLSHFFSPKNSLRLELSRGFGRKLGEICGTGFPTFFIDAAMGILTMLFNRQIMKYLGTDALAVYGIIVNISTFVQCCAYSVGQASQPIISINFGARQWKRIRLVLRYALISVGAFGILWTALAMLFPNGFVYIFMNPTKQVLSIAPAIIRTYGISFLLLPLNIFSTYYFQALMKRQASFLVSVLRGAVISGLLICLLPGMLGADAVWLAMPLTEAAVAVLVICLIRRYTGQLDRQETGA